MQDEGNSRVNVRNLKKMAEYFQRIGALELAANYNRQIIKLNPLNEETYCNLAAITLKQGRFDQVYSILKSGLEVNQDSPVIHNMLGICYREQGKYDEAIRSFCKSISLRTNFVSPRYNLARLNLLLGKYKDGFRQLVEIERKMQEKRILNNLPDWKGKRFFYKKVLIYANTSIPDTLLLVRYLPLVKARGGDVVLAVKKPLLELLESVEGADCVIDIESFFNNVRGYNLYVSMLNLPVILTEKVGDIPRNIPYIKAPEALTAFWKHKIGFGGLMNIGLAFPQMHGSNNALHTLATFINNKELSDFPGAIFHNLGHNSYFNHSGVVDWLGVIKGLDNLAAFVDNMDLIITTDNIIANLAGALGKRVWIVLPVSPSWQWSIKPLASPWYPTVKLYRQTQFGDWNSVIEKIFEDLCKELKSIFSTSVRNKIILTELLDKGRQSYIKGDMSVAEYMFRQILMIDPASIEAIQWMGLVMVRKGNYRTAIDLLKCAMVEKPNNISIHNNLAIALEREGLNEEAAEHYKNALGFGPSAELHNNYGNLLYRMGEFDNAMKHYHESLEINPNHIKTLHNLGILLESQGKYSKATDCFRRIIQIDSECKPAYKSLSRILLLTGDYEAGFKNYDIDFTEGNIYKNMQSTRAKPWEGGNFFGQRLLVFCTGDSRDTLQFSRYLQLVKRRGGKVIIIVGNSLFGLMYRIPGVDQVIEYNDQLLPKGDCFVSIQKLPFIFKTTLHNIPNHKYLSADPRLVNKYKNLLSRSGLNIGIAIAPNNLNGFLRDTTDLINSLEKLKKRSEIKFYHLYQINSNKSELVTWGTGSSNLGNTAAFIENLDLVITNENEIAHLSAALGKETWVLVEQTPEWRWLLERDDSPWYKTVRLFRNKAGQSWGTIIEQIDNLIHKLYCIDINR